jgi:hypothetical protein
LTKASFIVVNGIDRTTETGSAFIAKYTMLSLVHGYLTAGLYTGSGRVHELPRIKIKEPTSLTQIDDPLLIPVRWGIQWRRWDGQLYTSGYAAGFSEADEPDLLYTLCYSPDNGTTWKFMKEDGVIRLAVDNAVCGTSGTVPRNADGTINYDAVRTDLVVNGDEEFDWDVSTLNNDGTLMFPEGSYLIRLEVFRRTMDKHYAYHIEKIYIDR